MYLTSHFLALQGEPGVSLWNYPSPGLESTISLKAYLSSFINCFFKKFSEKDESLHSFSFSAYITASFLFSCSMATWYSDTHFPWKTVRNNLERKINELTIHVSLLPSFPYSLSAFVLGKATKYHFHLLN